MSSQLAAFEIEDCTVIIIPHDIDALPTVITNGEIETRKFDGIKLKHAIDKAERRRLDGATARIPKAVILPEES